MPGWFCVKCLHEFPDLNIRKQPEYMGMVFFCVIGLGLAMFGASAVYTYFTVSHDIEYLVKGGVATLFGLAAFRAGMQFKRGVKAICPSCGKPQGVPADSRLADEVRRTRAGK